MTSARKKRHDLNFSPLTFIPAAMAITRSQVTWALLGAFFGLGLACKSPRRLMLSEAVLGAARPLSHVMNVSTTPSCVNLCYQETLCAAARYQRSDRQCDLLTANLFFLEGQAALANSKGDAEVWTIPGRGFGECPSAYNVSWRSSRYWFSYTKKRSVTASGERCKQDGAKLAELTSEEEVLAISHSFSPSLVSIIGGYQLPGAKEPDGGWVWRSSNLLINMLRFKENEPNDRSNGGERFLSAQLYGDNLHFTDVPQWFQGFLVCECYHF